MLKKELNEAQNQERNQSKRNLMQNNIENLKSFQNKKQLISVVSSYDLQNSVPPNMRVNVNIFLIKDIRFNQIITQTKLNYNQSNLFRNSNMEHDPPFEGNSQSIIYNQNNHLVILKESENNSKSANENDQKPNKINTKLKDDKYNSIKFKKSQLNILYKFLNENDKWNKNQLRELSKKININANKIFDWLKNNRSKKLYKKSRNNNIQQDNKDDSDGYHL